MKSRNGTWDNQENPDLQDQYLLFLGADMTHQRLGPPVVDDIPFQKDVCSVDLELLQWFCLHKFCFGLKIYWGNSSICCKDFFGFFLKVFQSVSLTKVLIRSGHFVSELDAETSISFICQPF